MWNCALSWAVFQPLAPRRAAVRVAASMPPMASTSASAVGMAADTPALETTLPSATQRVLLDQRVPGCSSSRRERVAQCPVARRPSNRPALATTSAPSQMLTTVAPLADWSRSQASSTGSRTSCSVTAGTIT